MKIHRPILFSNRSPESAGFSLVELLISVGLGTVVVGVIVCLSIATSWHFSATSNYAQMDDQSRNALDKISKEIRNSTSLVAFNSTNNPMYLLLTNANGPDGATITYDSTTSKLTLAKPGQAKTTLLTGCDTFSFTLFNRYPLVSSTNFTFYSSTNFTTGAIDPTFTKVINMTWKCSRTILGSKLNTEIVQTAQVVLRNKVK